MLALCGKWLATQSIFNCIAKFDFFFIEVDGVNQHLDCISTCTTGEELVVTEFDFLPQTLIFDDLARVKIAEFIPCALDHVEFCIKALTEKSFLFVHNFLTSFDIGLFRALFLHRLEFCLLLFELCLKSLLAIFYDCIALFNEVFFKFGKLFVALVRINCGDKVRSEVNNLFKLLGFEFFFWLKTTQEIGQP